MQQEKINKTPPEVLPTLFHIEAEFLKDGIVIYSTQGLEVQGSYSLSQDGKQLTTIMGTETKVEEINELSRDKLVVTDLKEHVKIIMVPVSNNKIE